MKIAHNVTPVQQPSKMSCWAAATAMLVNWKLGIPRTISDIVAQGGARYSAIYQASFETPSKGIQAADEQAFYKVLGLKSFQGMNYSVQGWADLLTRHGPLSVTVDADPGKGFIHALLMTGLDGDGTGKGTIVSYIDPADGKKHNVVFNDYLNLYQGSADWPLQVVCNP